MALDRYNYGLVFDHTRRLNDLEVELICFRELGVWEGKLSRKQHFMNAVELLWGPKSRKEFIWHPWAEWYLEHSCEQKYLAVLGAANSGKTDFFAVWALVNWLCSPFQTKVMVTSTSLKESRKRIWGAVREYYMGSSITFPGKLVDSIGIIRVDEGGGVVSDRAGIELVPGEKKKEKEAVGKLIGIKAKRIILICDELPELSHALIGAFKSNLAVHRINKEFEFSDEDRNSQVFVMFQNDKDGHRIGFCVIGHSPVKMKVWENTFKDEGWVEPDYKMYTPCYELMYMYVRPEQRGKGFGKTLFNKAINFAGDQKVKAIYAYVRDRNDTALNFYKRMDANIIQDFSDEEFTTAFLNWIIN